MSSYGADDRVILTSAARTTAQATPDQWNSSSRNLLVVLDVTAASGTGGLTLTVQGKDPASGKYYSIGGATAAVTATGTKVYAFNMNGAANTNFTTVSASSLPAVFRVNVAVGDATSYTYSVGATLLP